MHIVLKWDRVAGDWRLHEGVYKSRGRRHADRWLRRNGFLLPPPSYAVGDMVEFAIRSTGMGGVVTKVAAVHDTKARGPLQIEYRVESRGGTYLVSERMVETGQHGRRTSCGS